MLTLFVSQKDKLDNLREMVLNESATNQRRDTLEFLKSIPNYRPSLVDAGSRLNTIKEADSTGKRYFINENQSKSGNIRLLFLNLGSILSELSFTRSEDDLDEYLESKSRKQKLLDLQDSQPSKKFRKSEDKQIVEVI